MRTFAVVVVVGAIAASGLSGCFTTRAERGALVGGATGAAIGGIATRSVGGAVVGGAVGGVAGYAIGRNTYRCWKRNVFGYRYLGWCVR